MIDWQYGMLLGAPDFDAGDGFRDSLLFGFELRREHVEAREHDARQRSKDE